MKAFQLAPLLLIAALAASAHAQAPATTPPLTRGEVLADVHIWNQSGLAELHRRGRNSPDTETEEYRAAKARYDALRASSEFPALVARLAEHPFSQIRAR